MRRLSPKVIAEACAVLERGGIVVFPTETSYGIAADACNEEAVTRVFLTKGCSADKSVPLIVASELMAKRYAALSPALVRLAHTHWPGPLTLVAPVREDAPIPLVPRVIRGGTIALRVSSHPVARALSAKLGRPIVATSANKSGTPACYSVRSAKAAFKDGPEMYLDVGALPRRVSSTIVTEQKGKIVVLRQGAIRIPGSIT